MAEQSSQGAARAMWSRAIRRPHRARRVLVPAVAVAAAFLPLVALFAAPAAASATRGAVVTNFPRDPLAPAFGHRNTWAAQNWSGYAETGTFAGVTGTWTVPAVAPTAASTYSSTWVGVDGFDNGNLIQTGTEEDYYGGAAHYNAWWEILPAPETALSASYAVAPGDRMSASVYETTRTQTTGSFRRTTVEHLWVITISDTTSGWSFSTDQWYSGPGTSAEWVLEAPAVGGRIATLAHYTITPPAGIGDFDNAGVLSAPVSSGSPSYAGANLNYQNDAGVMVQNGVQVSTPSTPDGALTAYNTAYGATAPSAPVA